MRLLRSRRQHAVTLVEVLLVLVVLVLIAATAWPSLERSFANQRLRDAADSIRSELAAARAEAMRSSVAQQFHYTLDGQTYWVEPREDVQGTSGENRIWDATGSNRDSMMLPENVIFLEGEAQTNGSKSGIGDHLSATSGSDTRGIQGGESSAPVTFYPDGTCSSARIVLRNEYDRCIEVKIHGLTGMSEASEAFRIEDSM